MFGNPSDVAERIEQAAINERERAAERAAKRAAERTPAYPHATIRLQPAARIRRLIARLRRC